MRNVMQGELLVFSQQANFTIFFVKTLLNHIYGFVTFAMRIVTFKPRKIQSLILTVNMKNLKKQVEHCDLMMGIL